jgi:hypothetical protein
MDNGQDEANTRNRNKLSDEIWELQAINRIKSLRGSVNARNIDSKHSYTEPS